eukprot:68356-Prymnesium_polylepis.2
MPGTTSAHTGLHSRQRGGGRRKRASQEKFFSGAQEVERRLLGQRLGGGRKCEPRRPRRGGSHRKGLDSFCGAGQGDGAGNCPGERRDYERRPRSRCRRGRHSGRSPACFGMVLFCLDHDLFM